MWRKGSLCQLLNTTDMHTLMCTHLHYQVHMPFPLHTFYEYVSMCGRKNTSEAFVFLWHSVLNMCPWKKYQSNFNIGKNIMRMVFRCRKTMSCSCNLATSHSVLSTSVNLSDIQAPKPQKGIIDSPLYLRELNDCMSPPLQPPSQHPSSPPSCWLTVWFWINPF